MSLICQCPAAAALTTIPNVVCPENFGQIQKVAFQRLRKADGNINQFDSNATTPTDIFDLATWTPLLVAADGSKIVVSPYINAPADSGGDARMSSGGNDDLGGIPTVLGGNPVQFDGSLRSIPQSVIKVMKELQCEAAAGNLGVFLFDENGKIEAIDVNGDGSIFRPIPIRALFIGSKIHGNYDAKDSNAISWQYPDNYSDKLAIVTLNFNPLTDLVPAQ